MHAGWNLLARHTRSEGEFYKRMLIITLLVGFLPAVLSENRTGSMTPLAWACVVASGISAAIYLFGLAQLTVVADLSLKKSLVAGTGGGLYLVGDVVKVIVAAVATVKLRDRINIKD